MSAKSLELSRAVGRALVRRGWSVAVAESCTGGLLAACLTDVPGSSRYVSGGVVAYADTVKAGVLGVDPDILARRGAVSKETARAMATGVSGLLGVEVGVGITGIAGPGGGTPTKPVGTVWLAISSPGGCVEEKLLLGGDREAVREGATIRALALLLEQLADGTAGRSTAENPEETGG